MLPIIEITSRPAIRDKKHAFIFIIQRTYAHDFRAQEVCESRGGRPGFPVANSPYVLCGRKATLNCSSSELRCCVRDEMAVLGSPSLTVLMVSVNVKQH